MGVNKKIKKGLIQKAKRNNGGMGIEEYDKILSKIQEKDLRNEELKQQFEEQEEKKSKIKGKTEEEKKRAKEKKMQQREARKQRREESKKRIKEQNNAEDKINNQENNETSNIDERANKDHTSLTFENERRIFQQNLKAQNHAEIMVAQDAVLERQIKMLQAIERLKKQQQIVEDEEQEL